MNNKEKGDIKTPEEIYDSKISCTCDEAYKSRQMADPGCAYCQSYDSAIETAKEYHDQFKPQPLPEDVKELMTDEWERKLEDESAEHGYQPDEQINWVRNNVITPLQNHIEGLNDGYAQCDEKIKEMSGTIESLQKELVVSNEEKGRLEKEKRQLLIGLHFYKNDDCVGYESISKELKITPDEVRVSIFEGDLMIKEFLK